MLTEPMMKSENLHLNFSLKYLAQPIWVTRKQTTIAPKAKYISLATAV